MTDLRRSRRVSALALLAVIAVGLADRAGFGSLLGGLVGDALYAVAVGCALVLVFPRLGTLTAALVTALLCGAIEFFQSTGIPADLAAVVPGTALVLGSGFALGDLGAYLVGAAVFAIADLLRRATARASRRSGRTG